MSGLVADYERYVREDAFERRKQFVDAIRQQITSIEKGLLDSHDSRDLKALPVVKLKQEDKDDLALFLRGSRVCDGDDAERDLLASFQMDQKADDESPPSTSSGSMESKRGMSNTCFDSTSSSESALPKAEFTKLDLYPGPPNVKSLGTQFVDRLPIRVNVATELLEIRTEHSDQAISIPASEPIYSGHKVYAHSDRGGHYGSISVGSGLNSWKSGRIIRDNNKFERVHMETGSNGWNFWSLFKKRQRAFELGISKSGLKRWKDGDAISGDRSGMSCYYKRMQGTRDLQKGNEDLRTSWHARVASLMLVALGLVGLLSLHVTITAL